MKSLKKILAVLLVIAIFSVSSINPVSAGNAKSDKSLVVVLDPGHGGTDTGATGYKLTEKKINLRIAQYCKEELEKYKGVKVYMTRTKDTFVGLNQRIENASAVKADVLVSIHINSSDNAAANGAEVYYPNANYRPSHNKSGRKLAGAIQKNLVALGLKNRGIKTLSSKVGSKYKDGSTADYYAIIRGAKKAGYPGVIVEHAFISNKADAKEFLAANLGLKMLGVADAKGIAAAYGLKKSKGDSDTLQKTEIEKLTGKSSSAVYLQWTEIDSSEGYEVYRSTERDGKYKKVATIKSGNKTSYTDKSVKTGQTYYYKVRPYRKSKWKKERAGFCKAQEVKVLGGLDISINGQSASRIKLSWTEVEGAIKYEIYRSSSKEKNYQKIAAVEDMTEFKDTQLNGQGTYYYKVRAVSNGIKGYTYSSFSPIKWTKTNVY